MPLKPGIFCELVEVTGRRDSAEFDLAKTRALQARRIFTAFDLPYDIERVADGGIIIDKLRVRKVFFQADDQQPEVFTREQTHVPTETRKIEPRKMHAIAGCLMPRVNVEKHFV